tara:strand:- start:21612 stop:21800 length:189 start_codon:yes stop_codon:yes gene_type:complete
MAKAITEIMNMSMKGQEYVLSRFTESYSPIELNGEIYMIPKAINQLIKELIEDSIDEKIRDK